MGDRSGIDRPPFQGFDDWGPLTQGVALGCHWAAPLVLKRNPFSKESVEEGTRQAGRRPGGWEFRAKRWQRGELAGFGAYLLRQPEKKLAE